VKRIAAVAALIVAMLAVPAAAMATTSSPGPGWSGYPGQYQFCQPSPFHHYRHHHRHHRRHHRRNHRHHHGSNRFGNCNFPPPLPSGTCAGASFTFSWGSGLSALYEISGPALYTGEKFSYNGSVYTIVLANTVAGSMELDAVNYGPPIFQGTGNLCSG
jgi:hypothetical protein